jgi:small GTP-binding protein
MKVETTRKIILSGNTGVGKTSLVSRYVHERFLDKYPSSIGVRIDRKELEIKDTIIDMIIWDLSSKSSQAEVPQSYLLRTSGVIYVVDISELSTLDNIDTDMKFFCAKLPDIPILIVANKSDKVNQAEITSIIDSMPVKPDFISSARDSVNVTEIFQRLGELMLS